MVGEMPDFAVVGAGPAGVSASVFLKRAGAGVTVFEAKGVGGLARNANLIEDLPGFPDGVRGRNLAALLEGHLRNQGIRVRAERVLSIARSGIAFELEAPSGLSEFTAVILAAGTAPVEPEIPGLARIRDRVFYEIAELPDVARLAGGSRFAVIGGGEAALDYAMSLAGMGHAPTVLCRSSGPRTNAALLARFANTPGTRLVCGVSVKEISTRGSGLRVKLGDGSIMDADFMLVAIGRVPSIPALGKGMPATLEIRQDCTTQVPGLFTAGDVRRGSDRHVATAMGDGVSAAILALRHAGDVT